MVIAMSDTFLLLIRHGQTEWNRERRIQGNGDSPLTELGHAQASAAAKALRRFEVDALYSSDSGRARQTVEPISRSLGRRRQRIPVCGNDIMASLRARRERISVRNFRPFSTTTRNAILALWLPAGRAVLHYRRERLRPARKSPCVIADGTVAIVSHGGTIQALRTIRPKCATGSSNGECVSKIAA